MRKIILQNMVALDGYFEGPNREIDWHNVDSEFNDYAINFLNSIDILIFGRITYQLMLDYWPTPESQQDDPVIAGIMNNTPKLVYSRTLSETPWGRWNNAHLINEFRAEDIQGLKDRSGKDMVLFGSSNLALTFFRHNLIDEVRILINPMFLGGGHTFLSGLDQRLPLKLKDVQRFNSGNVMLIYQTGDQAGK